MSIIPAKVDREMLYIYLFDSIDYLKPRCRFYTVTNIDLPQFFNRGFNEDFGHHKK